MACHSGVYAKGGKQLKQRSPNMPDCLGCIRDDSGKATMYWFDMTTDGGGWAVVAEQSLYVHGYPTTEVSRSKTEDTTPNGDRNTVKSYRRTDWPPYTEYAVANRSNNAGADASLVEGIWKYDTGSFGEVEVDMMGFYLDKTDYQEGKASDNMVLYNGTPWGDSHSHASYQGYRWFDRTNHTYNHWGQSDLWGHIVNSDLYRIASNVTGYARTAGCGAGWANNSCRTAKIAWTNKDSQIHKGIFMVRR